MYWKHGSFGLGICVALVWESVYENLPRQLPPWRRQMAEPAAAGEPGRSGQAGQPGPRPQRPQRDAAERGCSISTQYLPRMRRNGCPPSILQSESDKQGQRDLGQGRTPESEQDRLGMRRASDHRCRRELGCQSFVIQEPFKETVLFFKHSKSTTNNRTAISSVV